MEGKKAARRCWHNERANSVPLDAESIARGYDEACRVVGIIIGISFGLMMLVGIIAGW